MPLRTNNIRSHGLPRHLLEERRIIIILAWDTTVANTIPRESADLRKAMTEQALGVIPYHQTP